MKQQQDFAEIFLLLKHLQGQHDQHTHGNRYGKPNTSSSNRIQGMSEAKRQQYMQNTFQNWTTSLDKKDREAFRTYTGGQYRGINRALRENTVEASGYKDIIASAKHGLSFATIPEDITTKRLISVPLSGDRRDAMLQFLGDIEHAKGKIFTDKAFVSTTINDFQEETSQGSVNVSIHIPKGSKAAYIGQLSRYPDEGEVLLPPGSRFKVLNFTQKSGEIYSIELALQKRGKQ